MTNNINEVKTGIYCWTSPSGKQYVGQAKDLKKRKQAFLRFNSNYTGGVSKIDVAREKYNDEKYWTYEILEECTESELSDREVYWVNEKDSYNNGYNCTKGGHYDAEHRETAYKNMQEAGKAMWERPGFRERQKEAYAKARQNPEVIEHYRQASLKYYETHDNPKKGTRASAETREKQRQIGIRNEHSMKPVVQLSKDWEFIKEWPSCVDVSMALGNVKESHDLH